MKRADKIARNPHHAEDERLIMSGPRTGSALAKYYIVRPGDDVPVIGFQTALGMWRQRKAGDRLYFRKGNGIEHIPTEMAAPAL